MVSTEKKVGFTVLQCTWGILQTLAGAAVFLVLIKRRHFIYRCCVATEWGKGESLSLGLFIFVSEKSDDTAKSELCAHEYGHCIQSLILGAFYLPVIALPSSVWCMAPYFGKRRREKGISYYSFYTERWANRIAEKLMDIKFTVLK